MSRRMIAALLLTAITAASASADIGITADGGGDIELTFLKENSQDWELLLDHCDATAVERISKKIIERIILTDAHGALLKEMPPVTSRPALKEIVPAMPVAPAVVAPPAGNSYCVIPLHGEVGATVLASVLETSLEDAIKRKATVVVLDIDSPGGSVAEAAEIVKVLHKYNKKLRLVALTGEARSAAAVFTFSVKEIYIKTSGTFGAGVSPRDSGVPASAVEKMQSAWRAVARNSADEGGHEPLLAEAMVDTDLQLHLETVDGKPVVKEGPGEKPLTRKGKILTLTSSEVVRCGLAQGKADDLDELGAALKMEKWSQVECLGTALAEAMPKRLAAFNKEMEKLRQRMKDNLRKAIESEPSQSGDIFANIALPGSPPAAPSPVMPRPGIGIPGVPNTGIQQPGIYQPGVPGIVNPAPARPAPPPPVKRNPLKWKPDSIKCVAALQQLEQDLSDAVDVARAFEQKAIAESFQNQQPRIAEARAKIWDDRNKYFRETMPDDGLRTGVAGGRNENTTYAVVTSLPNFPPVIAFNYSFTTIGDKKVIGEFNPVFVRSGDNPKYELIMAKEGYVVTGILVDASDENVRAVKVIFGAWKNNAVDPKDTYTSDWIGKAESDKPVMFGGKGHTVIGTNCAMSRRGTVTAIGLVVREAAPEKK